LISDFVIVGAGIYGCGLAWELASAGADVVLLEQATVASGSSGGDGARGVRADARDLRELKLAHRAQELWTTLDERLGAETGYQRVGGLRMLEQSDFEKNGGIARLEAQAWMQSRAGISTSILRREEVLELEPGISEAITHAIYVPSDGVAPQQQTTTQLAAAARRAGAVMAENSAALGLTWRGSRVAAVETADNSFTARKAVILTSNAGNSSILGEVADSVPSWSVLSQVAFIQPVSPHSITHLVGHNSRQLSLKAGPNGTVQVSGGWRGRWNASHGSGEVDIVSLRSAVTEAVATYPELAGARIISSDASRPESCSPDGIPVIDRVFGSDNLYVASQWTAHGFALFPAVVEALRSWLIDGSKPEILSPFSVARFQRAPHTASEPMFAMH
jgi:sarcosine oxidase subunit beta